MARDHGLHCLLIFNKLHYNTADKHVIKCILLIVFSYL